VGETVVQSPALTDSRRLSSDELIHSGLSDQVTAIARYEDVIWKIRTGYAVVLYGALTLIIGKEGSRSFAESPQHMVLILLVVGLSLSVFLIDLSYVRKKLKFVVAREMLIELAFKSDRDLETSDEDRDRLKAILHVAGETPPRKLPPQARREYRDKLVWNCLWILAPIYTPTPIIALCVAVLLHMFIAQ
jgi:hypothetical protein